LAILDCADYVTYSFLQNDIGRATVVGHKRRRQGLARLERPGETTIAVGSRPAGERWVFR
jgi:hypothetical protein